MIFLRKNAEDEQVPEYRIQKVRFGFLWHKKKFYILKRDKSIPMWSFDNWFDATDFIENIKIYERCPKYLVCIDGNNDYWVYTKAPIGCNEFHPTDFTLYNYSTLRIRYYRVHEYKTKVAEQFRPPNLTLENANAYIEKMKEADAYRERAKNIQAIGFNKHTHPEESRKERGGIKLW